MKPSNVQSTPSVPGNTPGGEAVENWTKFVTLNPPNEVRFQIDEESKKKDPNNLKASAKISIINKSKSAILFKVRHRIINREY